MFWNFNEGKINFNKILIVLFLTSKVCTIGTAFLNVPFNPKHLALAGAGTALIGDPSLFRINPALVVQDIATANQALLDQLRAQEALYAEFQKTQAFERLNEEIRRYEESRRPPGEGWFEWREPATQITSDRGGAFDGIGVLHQQQILLLYLTSYIYGSAW